MLGYEKAITDEMVEEKIKQLKPIHPRLAEVAEKIHEMDLKKTVKTIVAVNALETLLRVHAMREARGKALTDEMTQKIVSELRGEHPILAEIVERGHEMDARETIGAIIVIKALKKFLIIHAARLAMD